MTSWLDRKVLGIKRPKKESKPMPKLKWKKGRGQNPKSDWEKGRRGNPDWLDNML